MLFLYKWHVIYLFYYDQDGHLKFIFVLSEMWESNFEKCSFIWIITSFFYNVQCMILSWGFLTSKWSKYLSCVLTNEITMTTYTLFMYLLCSFWYEMKCLFLNNMLPFPWIIIIYMEIPTILNFEKCSFIWIITSYFNNVQCYIFSLFGYYQCF